jgi:hypothetical protein
MICTGLLKRHYNNLFKQDDYAEYYNKHTRIMDDVIFKDTYIVCRFIPLYYDIIIKTHKNIEYLLYNNVNGIDFYKQLNEITHVNDISLVHKDTLMPYFNDVCNTIIIPIMKRHDVYSQGILQLLFYKLVLYTLLKYSIDEEYKKKLSDIIKSIHNPVCFTNIIPIESSKHEFKCWNNIYKNATRR